MSDWARSYRVGFKGARRTHNTFLKLGVLKRGIILADENLLYRDGLYGFAAYFSQMRIL